MKRLLIALDGLFLNVSKDKNLLVHLQDEDPNLLKVCISAVELGFLLMNYNTLLTDAKNSSQSSDFSTSNAKLDELLKADLTLFASIKDEATKLKAPTMKVSIQSIR